MNVKFLGIETDCHTCDCCGKGDLKKTIALDIDGEVNYYGTTCAGRALGHKTKNVSDVKAAINKVNELEKIKNEVRNRMLCGENVVYGRFYINNRSHKTVVKIGKPSDLLINTIFPKNTVFAS